MSRYDFIEIATAAERGDEESINRLAEWCESYGECCWNGECWDVSLPGEPTGTRNLRPVYWFDADTEEWERIGYELY